ncbi:hypothetical protein [Pantoea sp. Fr+CA_20]|uniref:hypothetical protein n=1 Tax=Pantoea sp. Fr+CA_20 TaxID=2929506 RepID=UPI002118174A|nr:hypothetical protein [Pantoea sp. Fr+CA_20]
MKNGLYHLSYSIKDDLKGDCIGVFNDGNLNGGGADFFCQGAFSKKNAIIKITFFLLLLKLAVKYRASIFSWI